MKRYVLSLLGAANLLLALGLGALWMDKDGSLRNTRWLPPSPITADYNAMLPMLPTRSPVDGGRALAMLERPLFSPTRRPPPSVVASSEAEAAVVDNLSTAKLMGLFQGAQTNGIIIQIAGKNRRMKLNESVDGWVLQSVQGRAATFGRNDGQTRTIQMTRSLVNTYTGMPNMPAPSAAQAFPTQPPMGIPKQQPTPPAMAPGSTPVNPTSPAPPRASRFGP